MGIFKVERKEILQPRSPQESPINRPITSVPALFTVRPLQTILPRSSSILPGRIWRFGPWIENWVGFVIEG